MKTRKEELIDSVMYFARKYNSDALYKALLESGISPPELIKMIVYEMFLNRFYSYFSHEEDTRNYNIIMNYAIELKEKGYVN